MTLRYDPFHAYLVDPGGTRQNGNPFVSARKRWPISELLTAPASPRLQAITLLYNSWASQVHAKVAFPRFFIQFGAWMLCGKISRNRSYRR